MRILILSVGGSCEPVVNAVKEYRPDYVYFLCSAGPRGSERAVDGPGNPCGDPRKVKCPSCGAEHPLGNPEGKSVVAQAGLRADQYEKIALEDPDDLNECYQKVAALAASLTSKHPGSQIIANYTGGTKTMSVALAMVGILTERWDLSLNKGPRLDLIRVSSGMDVPILLDKWAVVSRVQMDGVRDFLRRFDYAGADGILSQLSSRPLGKPLQDQVVRARQLCKAFDRWDRFDHEGALALLDQPGGQFPEYLLPLKKILGQVRAAGGYERVGDLLLNAQRRAEQRRYDDAIARVYRATELCAQIRLESAYKISTSGVELERLPPPLREVYRNRVRDDGKVVLALCEAYELLRRLDDPVGKTYEEQRSKVLNALTRRNQSIFAHGLTPMTEEDYGHVWSVLNGFLAGLAGTINVTLELPQLPREEILGRLALGFCAECKNQS